MFINSATVPFHDSRDAKTSGSFRRKFIHQAGLGMALTIVLALNDGGTVKPFRTSRNRCPAT